MTRPRDLVAICALLCLAVAAAFHPVAGFGFVDFDDPDYVIGNEIVNRGLDARALGDAFTRVASNNWHPLTWISHTLDVTLFGVEPGPMHGVNVLLHAANACLLFLVLAALTGAVGPSAFAAALFAVHPAHVESVAWISQRKDTLSTLFWLLGMAAWARYARRPGVGSYALVALVLAAGLLSKPMLVTLPFVFLLLDLWPLDRLRDDGEGGRPLAPARAGRLLLEKAPLLLLSVAVGVVTLLVQRESGALKSTELVTPVERLAGALLSVGAYLRMAVWPADLAAFYPRFTPAELSAAGPLVASGALVGALSALALWRVRAQPYLLVGWLWFLGTLVPVIGLVQVGDQAYADRYTYVPFIGLFVAASFTAADLAPRIPGGARTLAAAGALVVIACTAASWRQVAHWRDAESLWTRVLEVTRDNATAHVHLGSLLSADGRDEEALRHFREAARLLPGAAAVRHNLGTALSKRGDLDGARANFEAALRVNPAIPETQLGLADVMGRQGEFDRAVLLYAHALETRPDLFALAAVQRGYAGALLGDARAPHASLEAATASHRAALAKRPDWHTVANNLAWIVATDPRSTPAQAAGAMAVALRTSDALGGGSPQLLDTLAATQAAAGRFEEAIATAERAARLAEDAGRPDLAEGIRSRLALYRRGERVVEDHSR